MSTEKSDAYNEGMATENVMRQEMDTTAVSLGLTCNFLQHLAMHQQCVADYEVFDSGIDATEYSPMGCMENVQFVPVVSAVFVR